MKSIRLSLILWVCAICAICGLTSGCQTTPPANPPAVAYRSLATTQIAVDKAMKVYATAVVTGKVSLAKQEQIDAAHAQYRAAFRLAVAVARGDLTLNTPPDVSALADELQLLITKL